MAFEGLKNTRSVQEALTNALANQEAMGERIMGGYVSGSPERFAGTKLANMVGAKGEFAMDTNDPKAAPYFKDFIGRSMAFRDTFENPGGPA